jgi:hypothetical protein
MKDLAKETGSAAFAQRAQRMQEAFAGDYPDHWRTKTTIWVTAHAAFNEGQELKRENKSGWQRKLEEARPLFEQVSKDATGQMQDTAFAYLARVDLELGKPEQALATAQAALNWWKSPEARARIEKFPSLESRRLDAHAQVVYWMGNAHQELAEAAQQRKDDAKAKEHWTAVVTTLEGFSRDHGTSTLAPWALGRVIEAHMNLGDMEKADAAWQRMLAEYPKHPGIDALARVFALHYEHIYKEIEKEYIATSRALFGKGGVAAQLRAAERSLQQVANALVDSTNERHKLRTMISAYAQAQKEGRKVPIAQGEIDAAQDRVKVLDADIARLEKQLDEPRAAQERLTAESKALRAKLEETRLSLYDPLVQSAEYYRQWDQALKTAARPREAGNVAAFAHKFYFAGTLKPEVPDNWEKARALYEDFLAFPDVAARGLDDTEKRSALSRLGDIYIRLARATQDEKTRQDLVTKGVGTLQESIATNPANNALLVKHLMGDVVIIPYKYEDQTYYFPFTRTADPKDVRVQAEQLGKTGAANALPTYEGVRAARLGEATEQFRRAVLQQPDPAMKTFAERISKGGIDWGFYRLLGNASSDFLLSLAWAYEQSGRPEDVLKAVQIAQGLTRGGGVEAEEESETWWRANTILLNGYLTLAEQSTGAPAPSGTAIDWLERAEKLITGVAVSYPDLGDTVLPTTRETWQALLRRLNGLRQRSGLPVLPADILTKKPPATAPAGAGETGGGN